MERRRRNKTINHRNKKTLTAPVERGSYEERAKARRKRRREAELRRKKRMLLGGVAALLIVLTAAFFIIFSLVTVPEPSDLKVESSATTQILTWKGPPKNISYQVYRKTSESEFELVGVIPEGSDCFFVSGDLSSATLYEYKVVSLKGSGEKKKESSGRTVSAYTLPFTITDASAVTLSKESLTVSWPDLQTVSGFEIKYAVSEDLEDVEPLNFTPAETELSSLTGALTYTIPNLSLGTTYYFSIRSFCGEDIYSEWSEVFSATVTRAVDMAGIDMNKPMVALTFGDGPDNGSVTYRILDALKAAGGHATFFQLGKLCERYPEVTMRIVEEGHQIGCHTYDHARSGNAVTEDDIIRANDVIESVCGVRPDAFRAPGGVPSDLILSTCARQGQAVFHWRLDTRDWSSRDTDSILAEIQNHVTDGTIILMHNIYDASAEATERAVPWLVEQGYQLVTVDQLVQAKTGQPPVPGRQYYTATITDAG